MNEVELKGLSKEILSVKSINSAENQANELFEMNVEHFGIVYACIKDITFGGRSNLQDESRIQVHSSCNNYIVSQLNTSKKAILIGVGKYNDNVIICAFKPEYSNGNSTISKQIKKETIWNAIKYGFSQQLKGSVYACVFQPAFLSFYIKNHTWIHDAPVEELNKHSEVQDILSLAIPFPHNRIIFGAPGTGKSHCLNDDAEKYFEYGLDIKEQLIAEIKNRPQDKDKEPWFNHIGIKYASYIYKRCDEETEGNLQLQWGVEQNELWKMKTAARATIDYNHSVFNTSTENIKRYERVTFHPNYSYAQFVGTYKPVQDSADENQIKYEYIPGPFMRIYIAAKQNPSQNFLLLIEEINRANVAAVFGDVFQLLDRDENGNSEYPVAASEDIKKYLAKNGIYEDELKIPSNMYIWATMNSADQGVFPMDTAFKRRWEFEYIGIDENEDKVKGYEIPISATKKVNWNDLRKAINNKLITLGINEDKLLGPFFLSKTVLDSALDKGMDFVKLFESKVLMYLFEDAAKMKAKQLFNVDEKKFIYSEVCKKFELEGLKVFKFNEEDVVEEHDIPSKKDEAPSDGKLF